MDSSSAEHGMRIGILASKDMMRAKIISMIVCMVCVLSCKTSKVAESRNIATDTLAVAKDSISVKTDTSETQTGHVSIVDNGYIEFADGIVGGCIEVSPDGGVVLRGVRKVSLGGGLNITKESKTDVSADSVAVKERKDSISNRQASEVQPIVKQGMLWWQKTLMWLMVISLACACAYIIYKYSKSR